MIICKKLDRVRKPVLIHCKQGLNRTPVAAVLYLIRNNIEPSRAVEIVTTAYREQRQQNFELNKRGHYTQVLEAAGLKVEKRRRGHTYP